MTTSDPRNPGGVTTASSTPDPLLAPVRGIALAGRLSLGLPWAASLAVHACLLALAATLVWQVTSAPVHPAQPAIVSIDDPSPISRTGDPEGVTSGSRAENRPPEAASPDPIEPGERPARSAPLTGLADAAIDAATGAPPPIRLVLSPDMPAAPLAPDAPLAPPTQLAPQGVRFAGLGASTARSVVYVVDASGPMVTSLPAVIEELKRSVSRLSPSQKFGVIVFRDLSEPLEREPVRSDSKTIPSNETASTNPPGPTESFMPMLVRATPLAMEKLAKWLGRIEPGGRSNPLDGLRAAIAHRPDAVFLLSRGIDRSGGGAWQLGREAIMLELDRLNPIDARLGGGDGGRPITIKTIQFLDEDPSGIMQAIGRDHGIARGPGDPASKVGYRVVRRGAELEGREGGG